MLGIQTCNPLTYLCFIYKVYVKTLKLECAYFIFLDKKKLYIYLAVIVLDIIIISLSGSGKVTYILGLLSLTRIFFGFGFYILLIGLATGHWFYFDYGEA